MKKKIYFSVFPPEKVQNEIKNFLNTLRINPQIRNYPITWAEGDSLFMPLIYVGAITDEAIKPVNAAAEITAEEVLPFDVKVSGINYFYTSKTGKGSTIFLDILDKDKLFKELHKTLSSHLIDAQFSPAKRFTPHIPIANLERVKENHLRKRILDEVSEIEVEGIDPFTVDKITIANISYEDEINPKFSIFKEFVLGAKRSEPETEEL